MLELMVSVAVGMLAVAAVLTVGVVQIKAHKAQFDVGRMHTSARTIFLLLKRDLAGAGLGTSFYAGAPANAFGGNVAILDGTGISRGVPSLRIANQVGPGDALAGTDAIFLLRAESDATFIPPPTEGGEPIPAVPGTITPYMVRDASVLQSCADRGLLVLVTDYGSAWEPASMLLPLAPIDPPAPLGEVGPIRFSAAYGIDPTDGSRATDGTITPGGAAIGSVVVCVRPVTYWVDAERRLRRWAASPADPSGSAILTGAFGGVPINPDADPVLMNGVDDLQVAARMNSMSPTLPDAWAFSDGGPLADAAELAEIRELRVSIVVRTASREDREVPSTVPPMLEDHDLSGIDLHFRRELITVQADLRNMRLFDAMSSSARTTDEMRSYP